jgi:hypothetical protein
VPRGIKGLFDIREYRSCRCIVIETEGHVVRMSHTFACRRFFPSMCLWIILKISFSNNWPTVDRKPIGCTFSGNYGSLLGFASFQGDGKCDSWKQWLNKFVIVTSDLLGRYLRHSFRNFNSQTLFDFNAIGPYSFVGEGGRVWTLASIRLSWLSSHRSWGVISFPKQPLSGGI